MADNTIKLRTISQLPAYLSNEALASTTLSNNLFETMHKNYQHLNHMYQQAIQLFLNKFYPPTLHSNQHIQEAELQRKYNHQLT